MRIFSTFTGIGGFELGISAAAMAMCTEGSDCYMCNNGPIEFVGYSEIDKYAISVYEKHFKGVKNYGDITKIDAESLPDFDCIVGGFPCQAFSVAGKRRGFDDTRGTLFFDLARILQAKRPRLFVFENVKGLTNHDNGNTFRTIITAIGELGYDCQWQVLNSKNHGVAQNRERIIIVGHLRGSARPKIFPIIGQSPRSNRAGINEQQRPESRFIKTRHLSQNGTLISEATTLQASEIPHIVSLIPGQPQDMRVYDPSGISPTLNPAAGAVIPRIVIDRKRVTSMTGRGIVKEGYTGAIETRPDLILATGIVNRSRDGVPVWEARKDGLAATLQTAGGTGTTPHGLIGDDIRKLTPLECERLQAFPDNWTKYAVGGGEISDTQRYKMCGNAVTTNVIQAVFERIFAS